MGGAPATETCPGKEQTGACLGKSQISILNHRDGTGAIPNFGEVDRFPTVSPTRGNDTIRCHCEERSSPPPSEANASLRDKPSKVRNEIK
jgi:hypothetical protein